MNGETTTSAIDTLCERHVLTLAGDAAHDIEHIRRVVNNARCLAMREGARLDVVIPAAWLHDCVAVPKNSPDRPRASMLAAAEAARLLSTWKYPADELPAVIHAIEAHSFTANIAPRTVEAQVLQDADRLDALGAVGLARCLMLGGAMGRPLYDAADPFCERRTPDDAASCIDHFYTKLLHLADRFQTHSGREEAARRTTVLRRYLDDLRRELSWSAT